LDLWDTGTLSAGQIFGMHPNCWSYIERRTRFLLTAKKAMLVDSREKLPSFRRENPVGFMGGQVLQYVRVVVYLHPGLG
jgi:hypothetical protein